MSFHTEEIKRTIHRFIDEKNAIEAINYLKTKISENPKEPLLLQLYGDTLAAVGHTDAAINAYQRNIKQYGTHYPSSYYSMGKIYENRGCIDKALNIWRQALKELTLDQYSAYLQTLLKSPTVTSAQLLDEHKRWANRLDVNLAEDNYAFEPHDGQRKIRVGYACPFFISGTIYNQLFPIIRAHDRSKFEIYFYWTSEGSPVLDRAEDVEKVKAHADVFRDVGYLSDRDYVRQVRADRIDILVELAGFSPGHRFSAMATRCAPVQISYLNHTGTSGIRNVDYVIADDIALRKDEDSFFTEEIYRLPGSFFCFNFEEEDSGEEPCPPPHVTNNYVTFGCFGHGAKFNPQLIKWWCEIMHRVPDSKMLIRNNELSYEDNRKFLLRQFIDNGINHDRLFIMKGANRKVIIENHKLLDISLDTWPYCGGNVLAEALWYGVPVISYYDKRFSSTYGSSLLHASGCSELVAHSSDEYIEKAVALANNRKAIIDYRYNLKSMVKEHGFNDAQAFAKKLEQAYVEMLQKAFNDGKSDSTHYLIGPRQAETVHDILRERNCAKMLTICMIARNDNYCGNFLYRLQTSINYIANAVKELNLHHAVEILIVDWNSDSKLSNDLHISPDAAQIIKFIHVPPEEATQHNPEGKAFNTTLSQNVALRRATGRFLMFMPSDVLFPKASLKNLLELLQSGCTDQFQVDQSLLLVGRKFIPWQFIAQEPDIESIEKFLTYNSWQCADPPYLPGLNAHMGAMLMSHDLWHQAQGVDESLTRWGWSDIELGLRINQKFQSIVLSHYGIFCYEMDCEPQMRSQNLINKNPTNISPDLTTNDTNWGISDKKLKTYTIPPTPSSKTEKKEKLLSRRELLVNLSEAPRMDKLVHCLGAHKLKGPEWPAIYLLASTLNMIQPQYYLDYGASKSMGSYVVPADNPAVYYLAINNNQDGDQLNDFIVVLRDQFDFSGHFHLVGGDMETALDRLLEHIKITDKLDMVYYLPDNYQATYLAQFDSIIPNLAENGAIILYTISSKIYSDIVSHIDKHYPECIKIRSDKYRTLLFVTSTSGGHVSLDERQREEKYINNIIEAWDKALIRKN